MNWTETGLAVAIALPLAVTLGALFWPSDHNP